MKGHSERIPEKNFRLFVGKPLFRWVLDKLLSVDEVDLIVINTDARDILSTHGIESAGKILIRDRKTEICGDLVSMNRIIEDDLREIDADLYLMSHTTNPLLSTETIRRALETFKDVSDRNRYDSLFTVTAHQARFYRENGAAINHDPNNLIRTQDLEPWFEENSNLYIFTRKSFTQNGARIGKRPYLFRQPRAETVDIDDMESWVMAEAIARGHL